MSLNDKWFMSLKLKLGLRKTCNRYDSVLKNSHTNVNRTKNLLILKLITLLLVI